MLLSVTDAAKTVGVSRTTVYDKINGGELSRTPDGKIDTVELLRVFGELKASPDSDTKTEGQDEDRPEVSGHIAWLQELVDRQQATIERQARDLRDANERAERREQTWLRQIDKVTALLPAPEPKEEPKRGFLARVFS